MRVAGIECIRSLQTLISIQHLGPVQSLFAAQHQEELRCRLFLRARQEPAAGVSSNMRGANH